MLEFKCICASGLEQCTSDNGSGVKVDMCLNLDALNMKNCEVCKEGWGNGNGNWSDGCKVNFETDPNHCGSEGYKCADHVAHAFGFFCEGNKCNYTLCLSEGATAYADCNGDRTDGCETPINTTQNCGVCKNSCQPNQECKAETAGPRCCYPGGKDLSSGVTKSQCCEGLKLWRRSAGVFCWVSEKYQCAKDEPSGCGWKEVK